MPYGRAIRYAFAALAAIGSLSAFTPVHASERLAFRVDWGPLSVAQGQLNIRRDNGAILMNGAVTAAGLGALLSRVTVRNALAYRADGSRQVRIEIIRSGETVRREMAWSSDGIPKILAAGGEDDDPLTPIAPEEIRNTVDPFFPILDMMERLDRGAGCVQTYRVYDGTRRYDLRFDDLGSAELDGDRRWTYAGPARRCSMHFLPIGGFEVDREFTENDIDRRIWFARVEERHVPVRFAVDWALGTAIARIDLDARR
ncbi:MAG: DUF3108 domain-containing protein [Pseudomonadota bacterium]